MARPNDKIGPYTLVSKLGQGAFGIVWLAQKQTAIATTQFALKLPRDEDIDVEAFKQEAAIWIQASGHPNVLPLIDADIYDGQVVIVSEYVNDGSLAGWLKQHGGKASSIATACEIVEGVLAGLAHLHERRIIHRDLKPENILLQRDNPRVTDFGISRLLRTTSQSSNIGGTLAYMAPEAFDGKRNERTDIWSVGVIFYQLLAGRLPYDQQDMVTLIGALMRQDPPPLAESVPEVLRQVVTKALQRDASERYSSAVAMRQELREAGRMLWLQDREAREARESLPALIPTMLNDPEATLVFPELPETIVPHPPAMAAPPSSTLKTEHEIRQQETNAEANERFRAEGVALEAATRELGEEILALPDDEENYEKNALILKKIQRLELDVIAREKETAARITAAQTLTAPAMTQPAAEAENLRAVIEAGKKIIEEREKSKPRRERIRELQANLGIETPPSRPFAANGIRTKEDASITGRKRWIAIMSLLVIAAMAVTAILWILARQARQNADLKAIGGSPSRHATTAIKNKIGMELVPIPAGSFMMGSGRQYGADKPVQQVTMSYSFYMGKYEVTQAQWQRVMGNNPSDFKGDNLPVETVSWDDAIAFIARLNTQNDGFTYRLPTEAEWEYACRAGTTGDYAGDLEAMAWYGNNSGRGRLDAAEILRTDSANYYKRIKENGGQTHAVGTKLPNSFGLFDMYGNVWEWCQDWYHDSYNGAPTDGSAWLSGGEQKERVLRGGSWGSNAARLRSANRDTVGTPDSRSDYAGFRVVAVVRAQ